MRALKLVLIALVATAAVVTAQDLFGALGLQSGASEADVKRAYKKLARTLHPDAVPVEQREGARQKFRQITEAYEILSDSTKRQQYETGRRPHNSQEDHQYLRYNLFTTDFDGVQLRDTEIQALMSGSKTDTHMVFFWSPNFPDCVDAAAPYKQLSTKLRGTSVNVASFKCDDDPMACRRLGLGALPAIKTFAKGAAVDYAGKIEIVALTNFAAKFITTTASVRSSSAAALLQACPNPTSSATSLGVAANYLWASAKRSYSGVLDFGLVALEFSPCFDCETALQLALETVSPVLEDQVVRRVDCRRPSNAELCEPYRVKNRAWTMAFVQRRCWYATKKPFQFSDEVCEPVRVIPYDGKFSNEPLVNFIIGNSPQFALSSLSQTEVDSVKRTADAWAILYDDGDSLDVSHRVQWALLSKSVVRSEVKDKKGNKLRAGFVDCRKVSSKCGDGRPYVNLLGFGLKVKATEPIAYRKIGGWKALLRDIIRDAEPLHLHVLGPKNYDKKINGGLQKGKTWFVLFNAGQWCPPCNQIRPHWKEAVRLVQNSPQRKKLSLAIVECDKHKQLCNSLGIENYPSMLYFAKGRPRAEYNGARDGNELAKWAIDQIDNRLQNLHPGELNGRIQRGENVLVSFTAGAWCPPCTQLGPVMKKASNLVTKATVVSFNCDENPHFCNSFGVEGYPTVILFSKGKRFQFEAYRKDEKQVAAWANQFL